MRRTKSSSTSSRPKISNPRQPPPSPPLPPQSKARLPPPTVLRSPNTKPRDLEGKHAGAILGGQFENLQAIFPFLLSLPYGPRGSTGSSQPSNTPGCQTRVGDRILDENVGYVSNDYSRWSRKVPGATWTVEDSPHFTRLAEYESSVYTWCTCDVVLREGEVLHGC